MVSLSTPLPIADRRVRAWSVRSVSAVLFVLALVFALAAAIVGASWLGDRARLRAVAEQVAGAPMSEGDRLTRVVAWVYGNQGFAKNHGRFLLAGLGPTPVQVLEKGGDCADKSRLTANLLRELGVPVSLAMIRPCPTCGFGHTVALVRTAGGWTPVDSVYNITFPSGNGRFTPIERLRADPALQAHRIAELRRLRGPGDKINYFSMARDPFTYATTINWDANALTRAVAGVLRARGEEPWRVPRPMLLEDPKQFVAFGLGAVAIGCALMGAVVRAAGRRAGARPAR